MNAALETLTEQALALPADARERLAERLLASLDAVPDKEVEALWLAEATRRRDEVRSGAVTAVEGEEALAQVRRSIQR